MYGWFTSKAMVPVGVKLPLMARMPGPLPGAMAPAPVTLPVIVPPPPRLPPLLTVTLLAIAPLTSSVPAAIVVAPL